MRATVSIHYIFRNCSTHRVRFKLSCFCSGLLGCTHFFEKSQYSVSFYWRRFFVVFLTAPMVTLSKKWYRYARWSSCVTNIMWSYLCETFCDVTEAISRWLFLSGPVRKIFVTYSLSTAVVLVTRGTVIEFQGGGASSIHALCNMERLINKLTNKEVFICLYKLFIARGAWSKGQLPKGGVVEIRSRTTDLN